MCCEWGKTENSEGELNRLIKSWRDNASPFSGQTDRAMASVRKEA